MFIKQKQTKPIKVVNSIKIKIILPKPKPSAWLKPLFVSKPKPSALPHSPSLRPQQTDNDPGPVRDMFP